MSERLIDRLSMEQIEAILDTLPLEFIFIDEEGILRYYNKGEKRLLPGFDEILDQDIRACHKPSSLPLTNKVLDDFKNGKKDEWQFWIDGLEDKVLNRFFAVRNKEGKYLGCMEYLLNVTTVEKMTETKKGAHRMTAPKPEGYKNKMGKE